LISLSQIDLCFTNGCWENVIVQESNAVRKDKAVHLLFFRYVKFDIFPERHILKKNQSLSERGVAVLTSDMLSLSTSFIYEGILVSNVYVPQSDVILATRIANTGSEVAILYHGTVILWKRTQ